MAEILVLYHFLFFRKFYKDPFLNSTGELLSTHFPHWIWMGRQMNKNKLWLKDDIYYYEPMSIPFLSSFYPIHIITAWISTRLSTDSSFKLLHFTILAHYILGSFLSYFMLLQWFPPLISLFGALTISYVGASQRVQNPCIAYTMAWIPGCFIDGYMGAFSFGMALLSGYYPTLIYMFPFIAFMNPFALFGFFLGMPQLVPFLAYWPHSIRHGSKVDKKFGAMSIFRTIFQGWRGYDKGVLFFETALGMGLATLLWATNLFSTTTLIACFCFFLAFGFFKVPFRVPARFLYPACFFFTLSSCQALMQFSDTTNQLLILVQGFLLLSNANLYPLWPFTEWQKRPSEWFNKENYDIKSFPYFTGYFHGIKTGGYTGGFSLKSTCEKRGVTNPNGERV